MYSKIFVGFPITQLNKDIAFLQELSEFVSEDLRMNNIEEFESYEMSSEMTEFLSWLKANQQEIKNHNFDFHRNYHGGNDYPEIFGTYVNNLFPLPKFDAQVVNFDNVEKIKEILLAFQTLFSTAPASIQEILNKNKLMNIWFNNHSS